jgi:hydroxyacylglutathione hydrolase
MTAAITAPDAHELSERHAVVLIDLRAPTEFARGHPFHALSVPFSPRGLAPRVRIALESDGAVVLVGTDETSAEVAAAQLGQAGTRVLGVLAGGFASWHAAGLPEGVIGEIAVQDLAGRAADATVIDVREPLEWTTGHVPGARLIPLAALRAALPSLPRRPVITICEAGIRSSTAASLLAAAGFPDVAHVPEGSSGYRRAGLPLEFPSAEEVGTR